MLSTLLSIHNAFVPLILVVGGVTLVLGLVLIFAARGANGAPAQLVRGFRILLSVTAALGLLQALVGVLLVTQGAKPGNQLHYVYGGIVLLAIPVAYVYSDQKQVRRDIIIMSIAAVALVGAALRAWATGPMH